MGFKNVLKSAWDGMWNSAGDMVDTQAKADVATKQFQFGVWVENNFEELSKAHDEDETFQKIWEDADLEFPGDRDDIDDFKSHLSGTGGEEKAGKVMAAIKEWMSSPEN